MIFLKKFLLKESVSLGLWVHTYELFFMFLVFELFKESNCVLADPSQVYGLTFTSLLQFSCFLMSFDCIFSL